MAEESIRIDTPESVDLALEPAGLGSRFLASVIDGLLQGVLLFVGYIVLISTMITGSFTNFSHLDFVGWTLFSILLLVEAFLLFAYKLVLEAFWNGQTIGKRVARIRVVSANGLPVSFLQVLVRNLMRVVDILPAQYAIGAICVLASKQGQRLGDMVAGTVVVRERKATLVPVPQTLSFQPGFDLAVFREHVLRLAEQDLEAARGFWERRAQFAAPVRYRLAIQVAQALTTRMNWQESLPPHPEQFIEAVLFVRAR